MSKTKENRNFELVEKRLTDKGKWSWRKLGEHFNVSAPRAVEIFEENNHFGKERIFRGILKTNDDLDKIMELLEFDFEMKDNE